MLAGVGETAVSGIGVYDAKTGEFRRLREQRLPDGTRFVPGVVAVRHRIGYCFANGHLMAVDSTASTASPRHLIEAKSGTVAETDDGLIVWNGKKWVTVLWLTEW